MLRGTVEAVVHATLAGQMLILFRIIEQTRPAEKQQRYNQIKMVSHLFRLFNSKVRAVMRTYMVSFPKYSHICFTMYTVLKA